MAVEEHIEEDKKTIFVTNLCLGNGSRTSTPHQITSVSNDEELTNLDWLQEQAEKHQNGDEELTSLTWLQDRDLLKSFGVGTYTTESDAAAVVSEEDSSRPSSGDCFEDVVEHVVIETNGHEESVSGASSPSLQRTAYNPSVHPGAKPPFSFSVLIFMAIEDSAHKALPVKDIYNWIVARFPYFASAPAGWKNSVRHNLSLNKCFKKVAKEAGQNVGKGSLWCVDPEFRPNLLQALNKAPVMANMDSSHFPCSFEKTGSGIKPRFIVTTPSKPLSYPSSELSRCLAINMKDLEVDAAATMLALKNGTRILSQEILEETENDSAAINHRKRRLHHVKNNNKVLLPVITKRSKLFKPIVTSSPSEDHTYSACLSNGSASTREEPEEMIAESYNSHKVAPKNAEEEGAHALMNLAEIATKRLFPKLVCIE